MKENLMNVEEVARYFGCQAKTIRKKLRKKEIPGFRVGGQWRVDPEDLKALVERLKKEGKKMTVHEAAVEVGTTDKSIRNMIRGGELKVTIHPNSGSGRLYEIDPEDLRKPKPTTVTTKEAAVIMKITEEALREKVRQGKIKVYLNRGALTGASGKGKKYEFDRQDLI